MRSRYRFSRLEVKAAFKNGKLAKGKLLGLAQLSKTGVKNRCHASLSIRQILIAATEQV